MAIEAVGVMVIAISALALAVIVLAVRNYRITLQLGTAENLLNARIDGLQKWATEWNEHHVAEHANLESRLSDSDKDTNRWVERFGLSMEVDRAASNAAAHDFNQRLIAIETKPQSPVVPKDEEPGAARGWQNQRSRAERGAQKLRELDGVEETIDA